MAKSRKNMRKSSRKGSRKSGRKGSRRSNRRCWTRRNNNMRGGAAPVGDTSMVGAGNQNLAQGRDFLNIHRGQHGGGVSLAGAPVGYTGVLDDALRASARITPLDSSFGAIQGMRDQAGGGRRRKGGKGARKATLKLKAARAKLLKFLRRLSKRKMRGGAHGLNPADYGSPGMLLGSADAAKAMASMNPEWKLATDPAAFAPK